MTNQIKVANDLGYSSMKLNIDGINERVPSVIAIQRQQDYTRPMTFDTEAEKATYIKHLSEHMDVDITSPAVNLKGRFLIGQRAIDAGIPTRAFDVNDFSGKSQSDLSMILTLGRLANQVVTNAYKSNADMSNILHADIVMSTALPITEGKRQNVTETYEKRYTSGKHLVTIMNFDQPITVELTFTKVYVGLEGEMAQFAIANADKVLKSQIKSDFDSTYPTLKDQVTADDLIGLQNVLGIDIGEGTTDFAVITNGRANPVISNSLETGYGNVLQDAVSILQQKGINLTNRSDLNDYLSKQVSVLSRGRQEHVREITNDQLNQLVDQIIDATSETMRHAKSDIELVFVYGGGSIPLLASTDMRERLVNKLKGFAGGFDIPVIWINPSRAQTLNEDGLKLVVDSL